MSAPRLPSHAIWEVVHSLSGKELACLRRETKGTRLAWLLNTLLQLPQYDDHALRKAYLNAFPQANPKLLKVYKRQLWDLLEATLPRFAPDLQHKRQLWNRLWLSFLLWQKGLTSSAEILWRQVLHEAIQQGRYEIALWSFSLLELCWRDLHRAAPSTQVFTWIQQLLQLINARYTALSQKVAAMESYVLTRNPVGWSLPPLPSQDAWAAYMQAYAHLVESARNFRYEEALKSAVCMIHHLSTQKSLPPLYQSYHLSLTWSNIGILLINLRETALYEAWCQAWQSSWERGIWPNTWPHQLLRHNSIAFHLSYLIQTCQWSSLKLFYETHRHALHELIFQSAINLGSCVAAAANVYLTLLLTANSPQDVVQWRTRVEAWLKKERVKEPELLWWNFLRWYETYRREQKAGMHRWYRRLRTLWKARFPEYTQWQSVLRFLWTLGESVPPIQRRKARSLLRRWSRLPDEQAYWEDNSSLFPMLPFVEAIPQRLPLERVQARSWPSHISPDLHKNLSQLIYSMTSQSPQKPHEQ